MSAKASNSISSALAKDDDVPNLGEKVSVAVWQWFLVSLWSFQNKFSQHDAFHRFMLILLNSTFQMIEVYNFLLQIVNTWFTKLYENLCSFQSIIKGLFWHFSIIVTITILWHYLAGLITKWTSSSVIWCITEHQLMLINPSIISFGISFKDTELFANSLVVVVTFFFIPKPSNSSGSRLSSRIIAGYRFLQTFALLQEQHIPRQQQNHTQHL